MIIEFLAICFLILCANRLVWLIKRRRDVLYYVSKSNRG
jgi:hypothetical protein